MKVRLLEEADRDLNALLTDLRRHSPQGARRVARRIREVLNLLGEQPHAGSATDLPNLSRFVVRPFAYIVFYRVSDVAVEIVGIKHGARDPASMPDASPEEDLPNDS